MKFNFYKMKLKSLYISIFNIKLDVKIKNLTSKNNVLN